MKKQLPGYFYVFQLAICLIANRSAAQTNNCYTQLYDGSGYPVERHHGQLNAAACALIAAFPRECQDSFQVYDFGFYLHNEVMAEGLGGIFQKALSSIPNKSKYHLIFGKQSDRSGIYTKLWVELKLPTQGSFICLSSDLAGKIADDVQSVGSHYLTPGNLSSYATAEAETMKWLQQLIQEATDCCQGTNLRSSNGCVFSGLGRKNYYQFNNKRYYTGDTLFVPKQDRVIKLPAFLENETAFKAPMTIWKGASAAIGSNAVGEFRTNVTSVDKNGNTLATRIRAIQTVVFKRTGKVDSTVVDSVAVTLLVVSTKFFENTLANYGYDENTDTTELHYPSFIKGVAWKSIADNKSFDDFSVKIEPKEAAKKVKLYLQDSINFQLNKKQADKINSSFKIATKLADHLGETHVKTIVDGILNDSARLNIKSYHLEIKKVSVVVVNEKSDDYQIVPKNDSVSTAFTRIIAWGANKQIDTKPQGDDLLIYDPIYKDSVIVAGTNRLVETAANDSTIYSNPIDLNALETILNEVYRHALIAWEVDKNKYERFVNFDLNRNGKFDISASGYSPEMDRLRDSCAINNGNQMLFIVTIPRTGTENGVMPMGTRFGFVYSTLDFQTTAHELGHGTFRLRHPFDQFPLYPRRPSNKPWKQMDTFNLMEWAGRYPNGRSWTRDKLRKYQWDQCH